MCWNCFIKEFPFFSVSFESEKNEKKKKICETLLPESKSLYESGNIKIFEQQP